MLPHMAVTARGTETLVRQDVETRIAILRRKMDEWNVALDDHVVEFLADRIRKSVRRLEGGLMRLASYTSLSGKSLDDDAICFWITWRHWFTH